MLEGEGKIHIHTEVERGSNIWKGEKNKEKKREASKRRKRKGSWSYRRKDGGGGRGEGEVTKPLILTLLDLDPTWHRAGPLLSHAHTHIHVHMHTCAAYIHTYTCILLSVVLADYDKSVLLFLLHWFLPFSLSHTHTLIHTLTSVCLRVHTYIHICTNVCVYCIYVYLRMWKRIKIALLKGLLLCNFQASNSSVVRFCSP